MAANTETANVISLPGMDAPQSAAPDPAALAAWISLHEQLALLLDIGARMAQELQDVCDDGEFNGQPLPSVRCLVEEWETAYGEVSLCN
ncbi:hypothetical protein GCM10023116_31000 [Kistimonas scapharcae]|uniref:Uncharacterized protein n=1 Tax=Kistimonas scapharcae TaxID=1036133 RepID=A0ABP8V4K8_9GAMM